MELYINDIRVDLNQRIPFPLNFQISDIKSLEKRKGSSSKSITLPGTQANNSLMSTVFTLSTTNAPNFQFTGNFDPSKKATARYYENGIKQFEGICQLMSCALNNNVWSYKIVLLDNQIDVITLLKNYKLKELGWKEYNHDFTYQNQVDSWSGTIQKNGVPYTNGSGQVWKGEGYYYGLIDYGFDRPSDNTFEVENIPLQVFIYQIIVKMFDKIGVEFESDFFETQKFKRLLLAYEGGVLPTIDSTQAQQTSVETDQQNTNNGYIVESFVNGEEVVTPSQFDYNFPPMQLLSEYNPNPLTIVDPSTQVQNENPLMFVANAEGDFKLKYSGSHDVNYIVNLVNASGFVGVSAKIECEYIIKKNGLLYQSGLLWNNGFVINPLTTTFNASFNLEVDLFVDVSDIIEFQLNFKLFNQSINLLSVDSGSLTFNVTANACELDIEYQEQETLAGSSINIKQYLPDMDCSTFLKGIISMFNLYTLSKEDNKVKFEPLNDFYKPTSEALNWSDLVDPNKEIVVTPTVNYSTKEYNFIFEDDKDYWNNRYQLDVTKQYGSRKVFSPSQFAVGKTDLKLPFSNKLLCEIPNTNLIVPRTFQVKTDTNGISEITQKKGKSFIVQLKKGDVGTLQAGDWNHVDENDVSHSNTSYPYVGHLDDINDPTMDLTFSVPSYVFYDLPAGVEYTTNNLYLYHERFIRELTDRNGKLLTCYMKISPEIINNLDFSNLINIHGVIYRLQKIENYDSSTDDSTKCEFVRLIEAQSIAGRYIEVLPDLYPPPSGKNTRATEDGTIRITEDNIIRQI